MEKKIHQILQLVMRINATSEYGAKIEFAGHCNNLTVYVYPKGNFKEMLYNEYFYTDRPDLTDMSADKMIEQLTNILLEIPSLNFRS